MIRHSKNLGGRDPLGPLATPMLRDDQALFSQHWYK